MDTTTRVVLCHGIGARIQVHRVTCVDAAVRLYRCGEKKEESMGKVERREKGKGIKGSVSCAVSHVDECCAIITQ